MNATSRAHTTQTRPASIDSQPENRWTGGAPAPAPPPPRRWRTELTPTASESAYSFIGDQHHVFTELRLVAEGIVRIRRVGTIALQERDRRALGAIPPNIAAELRSVAHFGDAYK